MVWLLASLLASFARAGSRLSNQYFQLPGMQLVITTKLLLALFMLPILFVIPWPNQPLFYIFLALQAPLVVLQDIKIFNLTAKHGAGIVTRIEPLSMVALFFMWLLITPSLLLEHLASPLSFAGIVLALFFIAYCSLSMRKCSVNTHVLREMLPLFILFPVINILGKWSIDQAEFDHAVFLYLFFQSLFVLGCGLIFNRRMQGVSRAELIDPAKIWLCMIVTFAMGVSVLGRVYAFRYVDNPAYVSAIILLSPFWIILFYKLVRHKESGNIMPGIGIVCGVITLSLLTAP